ncbi:hypothetical protein D3C75_731690 [compost metagenome]
MIPTGESDDTSTASGSTSDFNCVFDSLGTGGDQQGFLREVTWNQFVQLFTQLNVGLVAENVEAGMRNLGQLLLDCGHDFGVQVTGIEYRDAAGEIQELAAFNIPHSGVFSAFGKDGVDLAHTTRNGIDAALLQRFVGIAHIYLFDPWGRASLNVLCGSLPESRRFNPDQIPRQRYLISR